MPKKPTPEDEREARFTATLNRLGSEALAQAAQTEASKEVSSLSNALVKAKRAHDRNKEFWAVFHLRSAGRFIGSQDNAFKEDYAKLMDDETTKYWVETINTVTLIFFLGIVAFFVGLSVLYF